MKKPLSRRGAIQLSNEFWKYKAVGPHENIIDIIEYYPEDEMFLAQEFANAKCLIDFLGIQ